VRHALLGFLYALLAAIGFSLLLSLVICLGADPEARTVSDAAFPLLGIFTGAYFASRSTSWRTGMRIGLLYAALWIGFWMYVMGRWNPFLWLEEGLTRLTISHLLWWGLAVLTGTVGGFAGRIRLSGFLAIIILLCLGLGIFMFVGIRPDDRMGVAPMEPVAGYQVERQGPKFDQTTVYMLTFDFQKQNRFMVGLYDCDSDDAKPYDDSNTSYMGQSLDGLVNKLGHQADAAHRQTLCVINGGFFGASGFSVAYHEDPIVQDGRVLYNVDLLRPKDQGWFFAVNPSTSLLAGQPRFSMLPSIPWNKLADYQTVLGGVRPLRFNGNSVPLKPGAGATTLRCSRTSVGWSADGNKFYILIVYDPDSEAASQFQRKMHWTHAGGWDVRNVQAFWEQKGVPFALLFDGGESTQLAFRQAKGGYHELLSGYQYSYTLGYLFQRPLLFNLPILPPSEAHRGVLNYLYIDGPAIR
jgi:hypothetical protein